VRWDISVEVLVQGLQPQKVCRGHVRRNRAPLVPEQRWCVICGGVHCSFADIVVAGYDVVLHERCRHFEVGIGSAALRILESDKVVDDVRRETALPDNRVACGSGGAAW
jgi:hypothetical protein